MCVPIREGEGGEEGTHTLSTHMALPLKSGSQDLPGFCSTEGGSDSPPTVPAPWEARLEGKEA